MQVNGEELSLQKLKEPTIQALLKHFECSKEHVAIEYNKKILSKKNYPTITLQKDDVVEIIHFVGGG